MGSIILVFASQLVMVMLRLINIRMVAQQHIIQSILLTGGIQAAWLVASALGIHAVLTGNWFVVAAYILGGMTGAWLSFSIKTPKESRI